MKTYRFRWRVFTSFILFVSTIIVTLSGVALYLAPHHRVADQTSWTFLLLDLQQWWDLHLTSMIWFMIVFGFHLFKFNWRAFWYYLGKKTRGAIRNPIEIVISILLTVILMWGTLDNWTVTNWVIDLNEWIRVEHFEKWRESQPVDPLGDDVSVKDVGIEDVNGETGGAQERSDG
jgi:Domain of unknown function (DUF4405)